MDFAFLGVFIALLNSIAWVQDWIISGPETYFA
jgi:hypothetical protein